MSTIYAVTMRSPSFLHDHATDDHEMDDHGNDLATHRGTDAFFLERGVGLHGSFVNPDQVIENS